jgi:ATP-dependent Clp protease ATP-binding subunit ClpB
MTLELSPAALDVLAEAGFDPVFGARPLERAIQQQVETPLAREIVAGRFGPGDRIRREAENGTIFFDRAGDYTEAAN